MTFSDHYELTPDIIEAFIKAGHDSARRALERKLKTQHIQPITGRDLAEQFSLCYIAFFCRGIRNNPAKKIPLERDRNERQEMSLEEKRLRLYMAIQGAAALCFLAHEIRLLDGHKKEVLCFFNEGKKDFYHHYTNGEVHPQAIRWLDVVLDETLSVEQRSHVRPDLIITLQKMFIKGPAVDQLAK